MKPQKKRSRRGGNIAQNLNGKREFATNQKKKLKGKRNNIMTNNFHYLARRRVNLKTIVEKYEGTKLMKNAASWLPLAIKKGEEKDLEYYIEDYGCEIYCMQPAFYQVNVKTGKRKELIPQKKNQYFCINFLKAPEVTFT